MSGIPDNLIYKNEADVKAKLEKFRAAGKEKIYLVTDFDRTITPASNLDGDEISTWALLSGKMPVDIRAIELELYDRYRPLELAGKMTDSDAVFWWSANLDLYRGSGLKWSDLELEVEEAIPARPGAKELFSICEADAIPAAIVSAGIKDVIELWCRKFGVNADTIMSTRLYFDAEGYINGWDRDSLVHTLNKNAVGREYFGTMRKTRPNSILIGDSLDDATMVDGTDGVLRFFIDNHESKDARDPDFYDKVFEKFDLIIQSGSLVPIAQTIQSII